ncbi:hypothetical protein RFI_22682, partial [Reticulomyxa filosa]
QLQQLQQLQQEKKGKKKNKDKNKYKNKSATNKRCDSGNDERHAKEESERSVASVVNAISADIDTTDKYGCFHPSPMAGGDDRNDGKDFHQPHVAVESAVSHNPTTIPTMDPQPESQFTNIDTNATTDINININTNTNSTINEKESIKTRTITYSRRKRKPRKKYGHSSSTSSSTSNVHVHGNGPITSNGDDCDSPCSKGSTLHCLQQMDHTLHSQSVHDGEEIEQLGMNEVLSSTSGSVRPGLDETKPTQNKKKRKKFKQRQSQKQQKQKQSNLNAKKSKEACLPTDTCNATSDMVDKDITSVEDIKCNPRFPLPPPSLHKSLLDAAPYFPFS